MKPGRFVTVEGGEGAGKSTQTAALVAWLRERGVDAVATREPGGAAGANEIRALLVTGSIDRWSPIAELLLHFAARAEHLARTVRPALERGAWVVCDRFADSTMAYQGFGHGLGRERV
ncbi:MAG: dTMP kinase, partial [Rhodospirillaceae bacterium]|nr:dTMP kinase [Rhodospirillaceae bacterium]